MGAPLHYEHSAWETCIGAQYRLPAVQLCRALLGSRAVTLCDCLFVSHVTLETAADKWNGEEQTAKTLDKWNGDLSSLVGFLRVGLPHSKNSCIAFKHLVELRCSSTTLRQLTALSPESSDQAQRNFPFQEVPLQSELPMSLDGLSASLNQSQVLLSRLVNGARSRNTGAAVPSGDFVRFKAFASLTSGGSISLGKVGGSDVLPTRGIGAAAATPLWVNPERAKVQTASDDNAAGRRKIRKKSEGVVLYWVRNDKVCLPGKPPQPRRSFTLTTLSDGHSYVLFGGLGLNPGGNLDDPADMVTDLSKVNIAGNLRFAAKPFNDTFLLVDLQGLGSAPMQSAGIGTQGTCQPSGPVMVPPAKDPAEPNLP